MSRINLLPIALVPLPYHSLDYNNSVWFLEFPDGCRFFRGPHRDECLVAAWRDAGCLRQGLAYPCRLPDYRRMLINRLNVLYVLTMIVNFTFIQLQKTELMF